MNILVINGSPKGNNSITLQTLLFLEKLFIEHQFSFLNVGQKIKYYEKNFNEIKEEFEKSDIIIFSYPVYTFLIPYQLHRFIELLKENNIEVKNKFATQFSTSKHFYDVTAHKFLEENCLDLGFKYIRGLSADMEDLMKKEGQDDAINFFNYLIFSIENNLYMQSINSKTEDKIIYKRRFNNNIENKDSSKDVLILSNTSKDDENLINIIEDFKNIIPYKTR